MRGRSCVGSSKARLAGRNRGITMAKQVPAVYGGVEVRPVMVFE